MLERKEKTREREEGFYKAGGWVSARMHFIQMYKDFYKIWGSWMYMESGDVEGWSKSLLEERRFHLAKPPDTSALVDDNLSSCPTLGFIGCTTICNFGGKDTFLPSAVCLCICALQSSFSCLLLLEMYACIYTYYLYMYFLVFIFYF